MRPEDRIRIEHMLDASQSVAQFIAGRTREDLEADEMLRFALAGCVGLASRAQSTPNSCPVDEGWEPDDNHREGPFS
jgi:hypothetical protein